MPRSTLTHVGRLTTLLLLFFSAGCTETGKPEDGVVNQPSGQVADAGVVITNPADLDMHVDERVVIRGELKRLKLPSVLGVDLSFNDIASDDMFGKQVECAGKLTREVVTNAPPEVARGDGVYYYALIGVSENEPVSVTIIE